MREIPCLIAALLFTVTVTVTAQTPASRPPESEIIHAGAQLVIVDIVVQDRDGHPIHGLKPEDLTLTEDKNPQAIRNFEEHSSTPSATHGPEMKLPPGTFTDYTPTPPNGALNVLLLDALNTPMADQSYVRYQLEQYIKKADPGTRIAIFGLNTRLTILQGFTSDPQTLKDVIDHKLLPRSSNLLDDPTGSGAGADLLQTSSNVSQFQAMTQSFQIQLRQQYTLDAFNVLAHYLSGLPGRKNLIWFSGSFPLNIMPDATLADPFSVMISAEDEYRDTTNLLTRAQVAVYPIDARGLMTNPAFSASQSGRGMNGPAFANKIGKFNQRQAEEHLTMEAMASDTGGQAFYNTNGLAEAVAKAIESGSNYYTLTYTPSNHKWDGGYRRIRVTLNGAYASQSLKLSFRQGYYADDPARPREAGSSAAITEASATASHSAFSYTQAAMARGAPTPQDILFKVRVLPDSTTPEDTLAPGNVPDPIKPIKGPFRRFDIDYAALAAAITLQSQPDGTHRGAIGFTVFLYDPDGKLLNTVGKTIELNLTPDQYKNFEQAARSGAGMGAHLEISAPLKQETYLRIAVHDIPSNHLGVVEIPVATVAHLPPLPPAPASPPPAIPTAAPASH
jgi:VWFA-related protein